jgi:hypothetical protein
VSGTAPPRRRRGLPRFRTSLLLGPVVTGAAAVGIASFYLWSQSQFSVIEREGAVVIQHGLGPFTSYEATDVDTELLQTPTRAHLVAHIPVQGRAGAATVLTELRGQVARCQNSLRAPCPLRPLKAAPMAVVPPYYPHGDEVRITWDSVDGRDGVVTKLLVDGKSPPKPCPSTLTTKGQCAFQGTFLHEYSISAVTTGPPGSSPVIKRLRERTRPRPSITIKKGESVSGKTTDTGEFLRFCKVNLVVQGFYPASFYEATITTSGHKPVTVSFYTNSDGAFTGTVYRYGDPSPRSWVAVELRGVKSAPVAWHCGGPERV